MSGFGKDSPEVVKFMTLFSLLKRYSDDTPDGLFDFAETDSSVREICLDLWVAAYLLKVNERRSLELFASPVDPKFVAAWRDYEERFEPAVSRIFFGGQFDDLDGNSEFKRKQAELQWKVSSTDAAEQAGGIESVVEFAQFNVDQEHRWHDQPEVAEAIREGLAAWERLRRETGFDLEGAFRRRALVPFVLVPRSVAASQGSAEKLSLLKNLQQAHDAFVLGVPYAAIALMRSVMEAVLRDFYNASGTDLSERINNVGGRLPSGASKAALHRLRKLANAILHLDQERALDLEKRGDTGLEREIISLLFVLRDLIEGGK